MIDDWNRAAGWAALVSRWLAAQFVLRRLALVRKGVLLAVGLLVLLAAGCVVLSTRYDPDWPWLLLSVFLVLSGIVAVVLVQVAMWIVARLALSRRSRPIAGALARSKDRMLAELDAAGAPVSIFGAVRFLWAAIRGRQPQRGLPARVKAVVARSDEVLDLPSLRATLDSVSR